jgi:hypothetical protein
MWMYSCLVHPTKPKKVHNNLIVKIESLIESTGSRFSRLLCYLLTLVLQILFVAVLPNFPARSQFNIAVNFTVYIAHSKFPGDLFTIKNNYTDLCPKIFKT